MANGMNQIITKNGEYVWLVPMGGPGYAIKGDKPRLGDVLKGPHYYTKDYDDLGTLAADIIQGRVLWLYSDGEGDDGDL